MIVENLLQFGLNEKEISVYLSLISLGPAPVKLISKQARVNRGTTYDILKSLIDQGLVGYYKHYDQEDKKQFFVAEPPQKLVDAIEAKKRGMETLKIHINKSLPELESLYEKSGARPVVKYYEGNSGLRTILEDVLTTMSETDAKTYFVYSSADIREYLYKAYPKYTDDRVNNKISVKVISIGKGGELAGLDERKWLSEEESSPTYILIYSGKVAMVSLDATQVPVGVIVENDGLYQTQKMVFERLWKML
ncbi:MAG: helix-turn-helix domain-containing protein [bacterium]|nr:helix-turn-helix domain-containing protein [bacterium]